MVVVSFGKYLEKHQGQKLRHLTGLVGWRVIFSVKAWEGSGESDVRPRKHQRGLTSWGAPPHSPRIVNKVTKIQKCYQCGSPCENWLQKRLCLVARLGCVKQMTCTDPGALRPRSPEEENHRAPWPSRKGLWGVTRWETGQARSKQLFTE